MTDKSLIRNFCIIAHIDHGKSTLADRILELTGSVDQREMEDQLLDNMDLERERGITIKARAVRLNYECDGKTYVLNLIDTPGHVDFSAETERTLQVLDYAILVISATDGVQSHTQTLWKLLAKYKVPCFIFVNKTDLDGADKDVVLYQLKTKLSDGCVDFTSPDDELNENIALCDDVLLEKYEEDSLGKQDVISAIKNRKVFPCMFGSALKLDGVDAFMDLINDYTEQPQYGSDFGAKVYKISEDKGQRLTMMKITGGTLKVKEILKSEKNINSEKVNQIRLYSGEKFTAVDEATAGTVCAVTGITFTNSGDGLGVEDNSSIPMLTPVLTYTVNVPDGTDAHTVLSDMRILEAEDPQLKVEWNERYSEIHVKLMGDIQLEVLQTLFADRFGINISFGKGSIIYKETIEEAVEGVGHFEPLRHYAEVHLLLKPGKRGSGLVFKTDCKEDVLDKNWQRLILTHLYEKTHIGVLTGSPITDMEIILKSGKAHPKHTEGGDFRQATYRAVRQGLRSAKSILLEPYYDFVLEIPNENVGRAMSDIQLMHGTFNPPELDGEMSVLTGSAPVSAMCDYAGTVRQYTRGVGKLSCTLKGYEPCHNAEEVIAEFDYNPDSDTDNTCDSVFCSKGAGYNVKWDEVKSHMHLPSILSTPKSEYAPTRSAGRMSNYADKNDLFALDKELMEIFEQTYGKIKHKNPNNSHFTFTEKTEKQNPKKMPKAPKYEGPEYLLVDGYNVIFSWDNLKKLADSSIDGARNALINILCNYQGYKRCEVIVVFDAYKVKGNHREIEKVNNITIVYTKEAETADMYIEKASLDLAKKHKVRVVTSDALEQVIILGNGALRVSSREFQGEVKSAEENIRTIIENNH